jgi:hypothetical protein
MKAVHIAVGILAIALNAGAGALGLWCYWRVTTSRAFWPLLRAAQVAILLEAALGGIYAINHHAKSIHIVYGVLPILVSFLGEQLRVASAQMILDSRGIESAHAVGELDPDDQRAVVVAIVQREIGVMALAAVVIVVLLARAAATG